MATPTLYQGEAGGQKPMTRLADRFNIAPRPHIRRLTIDWRQVRDKSADGRISLSDNQTKQRGNQNRQRPVGK
ncbi:protein of unknown function [Nitrospira defluvii]|uniref:Uncharacterized protein n=1 Tax=Nitrospira defluvii TaxID=330214 RepID=D8PI09_9BACT|nr:protein of unknown function [Nitrospira defluvii]